MQAVLRPSIRSWVSDDAGGSIFCSLECMKIPRDCPDIFTSCQNGLCTINVCEADGGGGAFMGPCDAEGTGDGTCEPVFSKTTQEIIGACFQAGTVSLDGGNCDPNQAPFTLASADGVTPNTKRPSAAALCPIGYQCVATGPTTGTCTQLCDPVFDGLSDNDAGGCLGGGRLHRHRKRHFVWRTLHLPGRRWLRGWRRWR